MTRVLVEPFCGLAAVTLSYFGLQPPCSRHGCKTGYAAAIRPHLGEAFDYFVLSDVDRALTHALRDLCHRPEQLAAEVSALARESPDARECWEFARREKEGSTAAWWIWCAGAFRGVGNWRGEHSRRPNSDGGFSPNRNELARRIAARPKLKRVEVVCSVAGAVEASPNSVAYLDPPYHNTADYPTKAKFDLRELAFDWHEAGARVVVSEATPRYWGDAAEHVEITHRREGQSRKDSLDKSEWLTILKEKTWE